MFGVEIGHEIDLDNVGEALLALRLLPLTLVHIIAHVGHTTHLAFRLRLSHVIEMMTQLNVGLHDEASHVRQLVLACQVNVLGAHFSRRIRVVHAHALAGRQRLFGRFQTRRLGRHGVAVDVHVVVRFKVTPE